MSTALRIFLMFFAISMGVFYFGRPSASWVGWLLLIIATVVSGLIIYADINLRRAFRYIGQSASILGEARLSDIYRAIETAGGATPTAFRLGRTGRLAADKCLRVTIPADDSGLPWSGKTITIDTPATEPDQLDGPQPRYLDEPGESTIRGEVFVAVGIPRKTTKNGKGQNILQIGTALKRSPDLAQIVGRAFARMDPEKVLDYLLQSFGTPPGKWMQDYGYANVIIGAHPQWLQNPEFPKCPDCKKRMRHIFEISAGIVVPAWTEGQLYVFGCATHPDQLRCVVQFT